MNTNIVNSLTAPHKNSNGLPKTGFKRSSKYFLCPNTNNHQNCIIYISLALLTWRGLTHFQTLCQIAIVCRNKANRRGTLLVNGMCLASSLAQVHLEYFIEKNSLTWRPQSKVRNFMSNL